MTTTQAKKLGSVLRKRRHALDLSFRDVAEASGVHHTTILRLEAGENLTPSADKLRRIAEALDLQLSDVFGLAGYASPDKLLPNPTVYLRTKYRGLSESKLNALTKEVEALLQRHGLDEDAIERPNEARKGGKS